MIFFMENPPMNRQTLWFLLMHISVTVLYSVITACKKKKKVMRYTEHSK